MKSHDRRQFFRLMGFAAGAVLIEGCVSKITSSAPPTQPSATQPVSSWPTPIPINLENRYIAYCGNNCERCPQYEKECPKGCLGETCSSGCGGCMVRKCAIRGKVDNCAVCDQYPCETLQNQYDNMEAEGYGSWARMAKIVLENVIQTK